ncbi:unnamed protein product [Rotaria socialis]|uniref:ATP-dependent DNA helicase n=2 Tax=Rotaria socialis TaxID=392032 RepID=A0A820P7M4_9BILA|nr:unnamed protein product [Rotaria socialis]CAF4400184.1 unnamed protein product [Rotaria socialis]
MAEDFMRQFGAETAEAMLFYDIEAMLTEQGRSYSDFGIPIPSKIYETLNEGQGVSVLTVAWTGIAPNLLAEGRAVHSRVKLTVPLLEMSTSSIRPNTKEADTIGKADVVIWDEAPMAQSYALKAVDILLRDIMNINVPFGGKIMVTSGCCKSLKLATLALLPNHPPKQEHENRTKRREILGVAY